MVPALGFRRLPSDDPLRYPVGPLGGALRGRMGPATCAHGT